MSDPTTVFNHDVLFLYDMTNRFIVELNKSQSNGVSGMNEHDQTRMQSYIDSLRRKVAWINAQPLLDLPETHPREFTLEAKPEVTNVESEVVNQFVRLMESFRTETINSQSARYASTLISHDSERLLAILDKMETFLTSYVAEVVPLDLPESSPRENLASAGRKGVNPA